MMKYRCVRNFTPVDEILSKIQSDPSSLGYERSFLMVIENTQFEFFKWFGGFEEQVPYFLCISYSISLYWNRILSVHQSSQFISLVSSAVLQYFNPSVIESNPFLNRPQILGLFYSFSFFHFFIH